MNIAFLLPLTVEDAVADLSRAADALGDCRIRTAHVAADLETRWAANRAARISSIRAEACESTHLLLTKCGGGARSDRGGDAILR